MMEHAKIYVLNSPLFLKPLEVMFNPTEYQYGLTNIFQEDGQFSGTKIDDLTVQLIFDSYEVNEDVREEHYDPRFNRKVIGTNQIAKLAYPSGLGIKTLSPPLCRFNWGGFNYIGVVKSVQQNFTMFLENGTPVRADVTVVFQSSVDIKNVKKLLGIEACRKFYKVQQGDRLDLIAVQQLKDASLWPEIARENKIQNPLFFPEPKHYGKIIIIPDL